MNTENRIFFCYLNLSKRSPHEIFVTWLYNYFKFYFFFILQEMKQQMQK